MFTITTATGKKFESDHATTTVDPPRLFLTVLNKPMSEVAQIFFDPAELPLKGYKKYKQLNAISEGDRSVNVILKP